MPAWTPGEGARLEDGWWVWQPTLPTVPSLVLALSGATGEGWTLCGDGHCREIGHERTAPGVGRKLANADADRAADTAIVSACAAPPVP